MQCQDSRGSFDRLYGDSIQVKPINYFAIKFPRYANKHWLKTAYTIVQPAAVQRGFLPVFAFFYYVCGGILHTEISQPLPFRLERHREGTTLQAPSHTQPSRNRLGVRSPSIAQTCTRSWGQEIAVF